MNKEAVKSTHYAKPKMVYLISGLGINLVEYEAFWIYCNKAFSEKDFKKFVGKLLALIRQDPQKYPDNACLKFEKILEKLPLYSQCFRHYSSLFKENSSKAKLLKSTLNTLQNTKQKIIHAKASFDADFFCKYEELLEEIADTIESLQNPSPKEPPQLLKDLISIHLAYGASKRPDLTYDRHALYASYFISRKTTGNTEAIAMGDLLATTCKLLFNKPYCKEISSFVNSIYIQISPEDGDKLSANSLNKSYSLINREKIILPFED